MGHEISLLKKIIENMPAENPGAHRITEQSLEQMIHLPIESRSMVFDWAHGKSAFRLVKLLEFGTIHASTTNKTYGRLIEQSNEKLRFGERLHIHTDPTHLDVKELTFDLIWSEGSIHGMGFENALKTWRTLLKPKGYLGIGNGCWQTHSKEPKCVNTGQTVVTKSLQEIEMNGYHCLAHYTIPYQVWWDGYFQPLRQQINHFKRQVEHNDEKELLVMLDNEVELFLASMEYGFYHNYEFYVCQKKN